MGQAPAAVLGVAYRLLGSVADAEDVTQDVWMRAAGAVSAARKLIHGSERVAEVMVRTGRRWRPDRVDFAEVGGELALVFHREGAVYSVDTVQVSDGLIVAYRRVINSDKLVRV